MSEVAFCLHQFLPTNFRENLHHSASLWGKKIKPAEKSCSEAWRKKLFCDGNKLITHTNVISACQIYSSVRNLIKIQLFYRLCVYSSFGSVRTGESQHSKCMQRTCMNMKYTRSNDGVTYDSTARKVLLMFCRKRDIKDKSKLFLSDSNSCLDIRVLMLLRMNLQFVFAVCSKAQITLHAE